jgi:hypothetical protein
VKFLNGVLGGIPFESQMEHGLFCHKGSFQADTGKEYLPEKLTDPQLVTEFPEFYRTRRFITAFKITHHLYLS